MLIRKKSSHKKIASGRKGNFSYFIRYFGTFTLIFSAMTLIIMQITRTSMYQTVDDELRKASENPDLVLKYKDWSLKYNAVKKVYGKDSIIVAENGSPDIKVGTDSQDDTQKDTVANQIVKPPLDKINFSANTDIILFNEKGEVIELDNDFKGLENIDFKKSNLNKIASYETMNVSNHKENFRGVLMEVNQDGLYDSEIKYAAVLTSVNQIEQASQANERIIFMVMASFWLISLIASQYLARLSMKPLLDSIDKQKSFVENASHELRTPLTVLQNRLETLFRKPEATILDSSESIASSLEEVRNMRLLTTNLLNLARRDDGLNPEIVDIEPAFFNGIFENYAIIAEENGKELTWNNQLVKSVKSDKTLLRQLMTILFDNAVKYTDDDGTIHFDIFVAKKDRQLVVRVADNGPGIKDSDKIQVFDRFYRVDKARTRQKGGFGLGLSLAKQIVEALRGTITVKDNHPKGVVFEARLKEK